LIRDGSVPKVDSEIIGGDEGLAIRVQRNRVDVVGMSVGKDSSRSLCDGSLSISNGRNHQLTRRSDASSLGLVSIKAAHGLDLLFKDLPQLDRLVICTQQEVSVVLTLDPLDLVDLLLNLEGFQIIEFRVVALKLSEKM